MKKFLLLLSFCFSTNMAVTFAQQNRIDSLEKNLKYQEIVGLIDSLDTQDENLLFKKAEALQELGNLQEAIDCLEKICKTSKNVQVFRQLANYYRATGDKQRALATLKKALLLEKNNGLYYEIAKLQYKLRYFEKGKETCNEILAKDTLANVLRLQSLFQNALGNNQEAKRLLQRAIVRNHRDYLAVENLVKLYKTAQDYKAIITLTETYLQLDSANVNILSDNAYAYFSLQKYRKAKKQYEQLFAMGYKPAENYFYLGYCCYRLGHTNDAYLNLYKANELAQELNETILHYLGLAAIKSLRYEEGIAFLEKALKFYLPQKETITDIYASKASAYQSLGQNMKAIAMIRKGMKYQYKHDALYRIAFLYDMSKKDIKAAKAYEKFINALPDSLDNKHLKIMKNNAALRLQYLKGERFMNRDSASLK